MHIDRGLHFSRFSRSSIVLGSKRCNCYNAAPECKAMAQANTATAAVVAIINMDAAEMFGRRCWRPWREHVHLGRHRSVPRHASVHSLGEARVQLQCCTACEPRPACPSPRLQELPRVGLHARQPEQGGWGHSLHGLVGACECSLR